MKAVAVLGSVMMFGAVCQVFGAAEDEKQAGKLATRPSKVDLPDLRADIWEGTFCVSPDARFAWFTAFCAPRRGLNRSVFVIDLRSGKITDLRDFMPEGFRLEPMAHGHSPSPAGKGLLIRATKEAPRDSPFTAVSRLLEIDFGTQAVREVLEKEHTGPFEVRALGPKLLMSELVASGPRRLVLLDPKSMKTVTLPIRGVLLAQAGNRFLVLADPQDTQRESGGLRRFWAAGRMLAIEIKGESIKILRKMEDAGPMVDGMLMYSISPLGRYAAYLTADDRRVRIAPLDGGQERIGAKCRQLYAVTDGGEVFAMPHGSDPAEIMPMVRIGAEGASTTLSATVSVANIVADRLYYIAWEPSEAPGPHPALVLRWAPLGAPSAPKHVPADSVQNRTKRTPQRQP